MSYEPPAIEEIGSVRELTLAQGGRGDGDHVVYFRYTPPETGLS
ncbi:lasso RiPP family leader peptide-containing protein [Phytoactinopolyspora alkaliphila]|uniref:Lasso RiPP family leader peptide-containing protein n=1 Tax=Phytoactinopolyspora alkaliphila TaxID=1783498 RepID=A0A6N9YJ89_9ACTN|nr:lasso RiPP family leader peptide-containing protein [Phytoactinopolyspora alkaliphila]